METIIGKSASRLWHDYAKQGGTLGFSSWLNIQKQKMQADGDSANLVIVDTSLNETVQKTIKETAIPSNTSNKPAGKTVLGVNKTIFVVSSLALVTGVGILIMQIGRK